MARTIDFTFAKKSIIPHSVTSGSHLVAVRIPNHRVTLDLLKQLDFPLVAPSANPYTRISPTNSKMVDEYFGDTLPCILEGDICAKGIESTIVGFHDNAPVIYRQGAISVDAIEFIAGKSKVLATVKERATTLACRQCITRQEQGFKLLIVYLISLFKIQSCILVCLHLVKQQ